MSSIAILGAQWGDEGKGRIVDLLSGQVNMVVRFQGGNNAGHTVIKGDEVFKLHLIPSGILYPEVTCVIGDGVVLNPAVLIEELDDLQKKNINTENLRISCKAHMVMPYHIVLDKAREHRLGKSKIGTTHRGIGPVYADKASRSGIRTQDLLDHKIFRTKLEEELALKNAIIEKVYNMEPLEIEEIYEDYLLYGERIGKYIVDTTFLINQYLDNNKSVLFEGAQGTMLDIDQGTYPYVTSSSTTAGGVCVGAGVGPGRLDEVLGIAKAYTTRVGSGPFPTEIEGSTGEELRKRGHEYGTTTGRARRCGWLDMVVLKYSSMLNYSDSIALTKLDILSGMGKIKICTAYKYKDKIYSDLPCHQTILHKCKPQYIELEGWKEDITGIKSYEGLPVQARKYIEKIEELLKVPVSMISVGPERSQIILRDESLKKRLFGSGNRSTLIV
ncbi:MAG TPA: adenylosuccinate synthase [Actinobacteria bacterium]|nr:adenylosuccinate synthase [Actinomycetota bacterium]